MQVSGSVLYNGKALDTFTVERTAAYVDQVGRQRGKGFLGVTWQWARASGTGTHASASTMSSPYLYINSCLCLATCKSEQQSIQFHSIALDIC